MNPLDILHQEHTKIEEQLNVLEKITNQMKEGSQLPIEQVEKLIDFLTGYADERHHGKEEKIFFPELELAGIQREQGPVGVMLNEHTLGRSFITKMKTSILEFKEGQSGAAGNFIENARAYIDLLRKHILKENNILFPMARRVLGETQMIALTNKFNSFEKAEVQSGRDSHYEKLMTELKSYKPL
jgi:hemerythrin-like domain-containing protein